MDNYKTMMAAMLRSMVQTVHAQGADPELVALVEKFEVDALRSLAESNSIDEFQSYIDGLVFDLKRLQYEYEQDQL